MVSELATNCIRHERASFHIAILRRSGEIRVEVTDSGGGVPTMRIAGSRRAQRPRAGRSSTCSPNAGGPEPESPSGKTVWFTLGVARS